MSKQTISINVNIVGKSAIVAYLLWWFLGWAGIHRFYLGRIKTGITQLLLFIIGWMTTLILIGWVLLAIWGVWWLLDVFLTYQMVSEENSKAGVKESLLSISKSQEER